VEVPHLPVIFQPGILLDLRRGFVRFWSFFPVAPYRPAVSAPDARTLTVTLAGSPAWFLADVCAGAYTMPVREDLRGSWDKGTVTNGPYTAAEFTSRLVRLERSVTS